MIQQEKNAFFSAFDKRGIVWLANELRGLGYKIWGSTGTVKVLQEAGIEATDVADMIGGKSIFGHRLVTLSRKFMASLLYRKGVQEDTDELKAMGVPKMDLVYVNFYPFLDEVKKPGSTHASIIEKIDIGGPSMANAAAKNDLDVFCDPADMGPYVEYLKNGSVDTVFHDRMRIKAFRVTSLYYLNVAEYLESQLAA